MTTSKFSVVTSVISNRQVADSLFLLTVESKGISPLPGQFAMLRTFSDFPFLSRPLSFFGADQTSVSFLYKTVGKGTFSLASLTERQKLRITAPLGKAWPNFKSGKLLLVAGGVGLPPLHFYKELRKTVETVLIYGVADKTSFPDIPVIWESATDDGSVGFHGNAVQAAENKLKNQSFDAVFSCGPVPMLESLHRLCVKNAVPLYVSLETIMACGFGVCHGCAWQCPDGSFVKVCSDGPVFKSDEVFS